VHFIFVFSMFGVLSQGGQMEELEGSSEKKLQAVIPLHWRFNFYPAATVGVS